MKSLICCHKVARMIVILILSLPVIAIVSCSTPLANATEEPTNGVVIDTQVFTQTGIPLENTQTPQVASEPLSTKEPAIASDNSQAQRSAGNLIAFVCGQISQDQTEENYFLAVTDIEGKNSKILLPDDIHSGIGPLWSPDGSTLLIESSSTIYFVNPDGSGPPVIFEYGDWPTWLSDSQRIVARISSDIGIANRNGEIIKIYPIQHTDHGALQRPVISPDGTMVAFIYSDYPNGTDGGVAYNVKVLDLSSGQVSQLTDFPVVTGITDSLNWTTDSNSIIFSYKNDEFRPGMIASIGVGSETLKNLGLGKDPKLSPDGTRILYTGDGSLWIMNLDGSNKQETAQNMLHGSWSPDGESILSGGGNIIRILGLDGNVKESFPIELCNSVTSFDPPVLQP